MTTVVMTGATGFVGRQVLPLLMEAGYEIHVLGRRSPDVQGVEFHACDLRSGDGVREGLDAAAASHLLHLAWDVPPGEFWEAPANLDWVAASLRLYREFATFGGKRAVLAGTCAEYAWDGDQVLVEGTTPLQPTTLYGLAKRNLFQLLTRASERVGVDVAWGRLFFLYGPAEAEERLVPQVIKSLLADAEFAGTSGQQVRDFMHVSDAARAFAAILASDYSGPVNISTGRPVSVADIAQTIGKLMDRAELLRLGTLPDRPGEPAVLLGNSEILRDQVGFDDFRSLDDGLANTIEWWRARVGNRTRTIESQKL